jgi:hypothetical protein
MFSVVHAPGLTQDRSQSVVVSAKGQKQIFSCGVISAGRLFVRRSSGVQVGETAVPAME